MAASTSESVGVKDEVEGTTIPRDSTKIALGKSSLPKTDGAMVDDNTSILKLLDVGTADGDQDRGVYTSRYAATQNENLLHDNGKQDVNGVCTLMVQELDPSTKEHAQEDVSEKLLAGPKREDYCKVCLQWVVYLADTTEEKTHWMELPAMLVAVSQDCEYCTFIHKCINTLYPEVFLNSEARLNITTRYGKLFLTLYGGDMPQKNLEVFSVGYDDVVLEVPLVVVRSEDIPHHTDEIGGYEMDRLSHPPLDIAVRPVLPHGTDSDQTLLTICKWVNGCDEHHEDTCGVRPNRLSQTPKRILHVTEDRVRLVGCPNQELLYVCLSHCWGTIQVASTTSRTIDAYQSEIPLESLTQTFTDAIDICRRLGIEHLWIDSLCIVQDSEDDWKEESAKMAGIYAGAYFTIAASKSKDGNGGCYATIDPEYIGVEVPDTGACIRVQTPTFDETYVKDSAWPLLKRGWVYQELRMSRRVIHFGSQEVVWQCRNGRRSESGLNDRKISILSREAHLRSQSKDQVHNGELYKRWHSTVANYSNRDLTCAKDKFPALAALILEELLQREDKFLAGLWESTLIHDLGWRARHAKDRPEVLLGPTWSWVTVDSEISYICEFSGFIPVMDVEDHQYEIEGPQHMPKILIATLTINAPLFPVIYGGDGNLEMDPLMLSSNVYVIASVSPDYKFDTRGRYHIPVGQELHLAIMGIERYYMGRGFRCLLLQKRDKSRKPNAGEEKNAHETFNRVGYAEIRDVEIYRAMKNDQYVYPGDRPLEPLVNEIRDHQRRRFMLI